MYVGREGGAIGVSLCTRQLERKLTAIYFTGRNWGKEKLGLALILSEAPVPWRRPSPDTQEMSFSRRKGFYKQEVNRTVWELPRQYTSIVPVGSGAYGSVWWVAFCFLKFLANWEGLKAWVLGQNDDFPHFYYKKDFHFGRGVSFFPVPVCDVILSVRWSALMSNSRVKAFPVFHWPISYKSPHVRFHLLGALIYKTVEGCTHTVLFLS